MQPAIDPSPDSIIPSSNQEPQESSFAAASVWLLTNAPSPYQAELLTAISSRPDVELTVRFMRSSSSSGQAVSSGFHSLTMSGLAPTNWRDEVRLHPRALWDAAFGRFDCYVLSGLYTSITFLCCAAILTIRRKPWIVWLERPRQSGIAKPKSDRNVLSRLRTGVRNRLLAASTRILCIGSAAREAYSTMIDRPDKLDVLPYCCDLTRYDHVAEVDVARYRSEQGLDGQFVFLFSGQLVARKGVDTLIDAFNQLGSDLPPATLLILGEGPLRPELEARVDPSRRDRVQFLGHLPQQQLPVVFKSADVFVFPSRRDGWAVVINEACAAELAIIASLETGAAHDLVRGGENGFRHPADDVDAFRDSMITLLTDPGLRRRYGKRSRELVETYSPPNGAALFADAVRRALA